MVNFISKEKPDQLRNDSNEAFAEINRINHAFFF